MGGRQGPWQTQSWRHVQGWLVAPNAPPTWAGCRSSPPGHSHWETGPPPTQGAPPTSGLSQCTARRRPSKGWGPASPPRPPLPALWAPVPAVTSPSHIWSPHLGFGFCERPHGAGVSPGSAETPAPSGTCRCGRCTSSPLPRRHARPTPGAPDTAVCFTICTRTMATPSMTMDKTGPGPLFISDRCWHPCPQSHGGRGPTGAGSTVALVGAGSPPPGSGSSDWGSL